MCTIEKVRGEKKKHRGNEMTRTKKMVGRKVYDTEYRSETLYKVATAHGSWAPGDGTHEMRVVTLKQEGNGRYVIASDFGCSRTYAVGTDAEAIRLFVGEHACRVVKIS
jgi:hypothetical protein